MIDFVQFQRLAGDFAVAAEHYVQFRDEPRRERLRAIRSRIVAILLDDPAIGAEQAFSAILQSIAVSSVKSGVRAFPRTAGENDLLARSLTSMRRAQAGNAAIQALPALLLAWHACELKFLPPIESIPASARPAWFVFLFEAPPIFAYNGDADDFAGYLGQLCERVGEYLRQSGHQWSDLAAAFNSSLAFSQSYFNELNLRDTMRGRGAIIELILERGGAVVDQLRVLRPIRERPRIGFVAAGISDGTESVFLAAHMDRLDRQKYEVCLYSLYEPAGNLGALCRGAAQSYARLPGNLREAVAKLRLDDLDMAVFSTNLTYFNHPLTQIAAHRVARIQVSTIASPVTTGLRNIDAMISGELNETADARKHYTEFLVCLPGALNCYPFQYMLKGLAPPESISRAKIGIPDDVTLFISTANFFKLLPEVTELWFKILHRVPRSRLLLMPFGPNWSSSYPVDLFLTRLRRQLADAGVSADRMHLLPAVPTIGHLHCVLRLADVYLDSFPFSGACSVYDAMQVGLPIVARTGSVCRSRHSKAILDEAGLGHWVTDDNGDYLERAVGLGSDPALRRNERECLAQVREAGFRLTDTTSYAAKLMPILDGMLLEWNRNVEAKRGEEPACLAERIAELSVKVGVRMSSFTDLDLVVSIVLPYLRPARGRCMIDVGACVGAITKPFLEEGWRAVLFEPDPRCQQQLAALVTAHSGKARLEASAVAVGCGGTTAFHLASLLGLSGLSSSPYAADIATVNVPAIDLPVYLAGSGLVDVDFIKIDVEGHDFAVLQSIEFDKVAPRLVMVEFGDQFAGQDRDTIGALLRHMRGVGYRACVVCLHALGRFERHEWQTRLLAIGIDVVPVLPAGARSFGNILFFQDDDSDFLPSLHDWLQQASKWQ
jgi:FkbM family methyltransferase